MSKRLPLLALIALAPVAWFVLEGAVLTLQDGSILARYDAAGLTTGIASIVLMRDVAARHAAWGACIAIAAWRSIRVGEAPGTPGTRSRCTWLGWAATWLWVPLSACLGVVVAAATSLVLASTVFRADISVLLGKIAELSRPQDVALLLLRSSLFATVVTAGAHSWRQRLGPLAGAPRWNVTLWRAGATCAALTLLDLLPWWRLVDDQPPAGGFPIDLTTLS